MSSTREALEILALIIKVKKVLKQSFGVIPDVKDLKQSEPYVKGNNYD